jgi:hypothetical protein
VQRILREARFFDPDKEVRDPRTPQRVLSDLMGSGWGVQVLYRAIVDGREHVPIVCVDAEGRRQKGVSGQILEADHAWLRGQVVPQQPAGGAGSDGDSSTGADDGGPALPDRLLLTRLAAVRSVVDRLEDAHAELRDVKDASGKILVDDDGVAEDTADEIRQRLENIRTQFLLYGETWKRRNNDRPSDDSDEAEQTEDDFS